MGCCSSSASVESKYDEKNSRLRPHETHHAAYNNINKQQSLQAFEGDNNYVKTKAGLWLHSQVFEPTDAPIGVVCIIHGFHEHAARDGYKYLIAKLNKEGFVVHAHDHQGHGLSNGEQAYFPRLNCLENDIVELIDIRIKSKAAFRSLPLFLWGHSMGGLLTVLTAMSHPDLFTGIAPAIRLNAAKYACGKAALAPKLSECNPKGWIYDPIPATAVARDPAAQVNYNKTPLMVAHGFVRLRSGAELMLGGFYAQRHLDRLTTPFVVAHGDADKLCDISGAELLMEQAASKDKEFILMPGMFHELYEDPERDVYYDKLLPWLVTRAKSATH